MVLPVLLSLLALSGLLAGCSPETTTGPPADPPVEDTQAVEPTTEPEPDPEPDAASTYAWTEIELTDVTTGETFSIGDFAGSQVLMQVFAVW
jgi:hypothetical protein